MMYDENEMMPINLKNLYTASEWKVVASEFQNHVDDGTYFKEIAKDLEVGHEDY